MKVLVIGATGMIGRPAVRKLLADGHDVTGLARNDERAAAVATQGITPVVADLFDADSLAGALVGQEAVINLATRIPTPGKAALGMGWAETIKIRTVGSTALVDAALNSGDVRIIVQEGVSFYYADGGEAEITEESPVDVPENLRSAVIAHENVARFAGDGRVGIGLRIAGLVGDDPMTRFLRKGARFGIPVTFGDAAGWTVAVHPSDAATGAVAALGAPTGEYNVGARPLRKRELGAVLAGEHKPHTIPPGMLRFMGPAAALGRSQRVLSTKLTEATGWQPALPSPSAEWFSERS